MDRTPEIPPQGWLHYFEGLSQRALNHPLRVEVEDEELGYQDLVHGLPLLGIEVESKGSEMGDIEILMGEEHQPFTHRIIRPLRVFLAIDDEGNLDCLFIENRGGAKTMIFFEGAVGVPAWPHPSPRDTESPSLGV